MKKNSTTIDNNTVFNQDVLNTGTYLYNSEQLSCELANGRINEGIQEVINCTGKTFFDVGCGDGITAETLYKMGAQFVCGIDPAKEAVNAANNRCSTYGKTTQSFEVGDIYTYESDESYDVVTFSRTLHHMPDPKTAIYNARNFGNSMLIIEPNGANPVLKTIEKLSKYHREHGERSFLYMSIKRWLKHAGFQVVRMKYVNLVPMFCPDWMAKICKFFEPIVERIPIIRNICCGQVVIYAEKKKH